MAMLTLQADHWTTLQPEQLRDSVRMTTKQLFDRGLVIIDVSAEEALISDRLPKDQMQC